MKRLVVTVFCVTAVNAQEGAMFRDANERYVFACNYAYEIIRG